MTGNVVYTDSHGRDVRDVTDYYWRAYGDSVVAAERCEANVFILFREEEDYALSYHWLTGESAELCEVQGSETTHWPLNEVDPHGRLFEQFSAIS